jgi:hypothetical protein
MVAGSARDADLSARPLALVYVKLGRSLIYDCHFRACCNGFGQLCRAAVISISTWTPAGKEVTSTVVRPGGSTVKYSAYTSFIAPKSDRFVIYTTERMASSIDRPASARMAFTLFNV